jgi:hypothetical protein
MAYEASEIMLAAALMYDDNELNHFSKDARTLREMMMDARLKLEKQSDLFHVYFGNANIKRGFIDLMDENKAESLKDLAVGISAAIATKKFISSNGGFTPSLKIYMTGNVWPQNVEKFRVSAYGFEDYNSADVIVEGKKDHFYGISLKKKRKTNAGEPTLINKAFDSVMEGRQFDRIKDELAQIRSDYFSGLVIEAVENKIILKEHIENFDQLKATKQGRKELFEAKKRNKNLFDRSYIDTKGSARALKGYKDDNTRDPNSMRYFVNKKLSEKNNPLWKEIIKVMDDNADVFAESLINIILKIKLFDEIESKDIKKYKFDFSLITGIGDVSSKGDVAIGKATILPLKTTLCGLSRIEEMYKDQKPQIILNDGKKGETDAAKIFLQLKRGRITILDLEIRYKGAFTPQPQFQGTLNSEFKKLLEKECEIS